MPTLEYLFGEEEGYFFGPDRTPKTMRDGMLNSMRQEENRPARKLEDVKKTIEEAKHLLTLEDNWDDDGASATTQDCFDRTVELILSVSTNTIYKGHTPIIPNYIDVMRDGSMGVSWENKEITVFTIVDKDPEKTTNTYGEEKVTSELLGESFGLRSTDNVKQAKLIADWFDTHSFKK